MKIRTKLIALFLCLSMQPSGLVYADNHDDDSVLDFMAAINAAAFRKRKDFDTFRCKELNETLQTLDCGDGSPGSWVDNYIVVFIDSDEIFFNASILTINNLGKIVPLNKSHCNATSVTGHEATYAELPDHLKDEVDNRPNGKKAVLFRVRVTEGTGTVPVLADVQCIEQVPDEPKE